MNTIFRLLAIVIGMASATPVLPQSDPEVDYKPISGPKNMAPLPVMMSTQSVAPYTRILVPSYVNSASTSAIRFTEWRSTQAQPYHVHGIAVQPPASLLRKVLGGSDLKADEKDEVVTELAQWYASTVGQRMSLSHRKQLASLYQQFAKMEQPSSAKTFDDAERAAVIKVNAESLVRFLLEERRILAASPAAQLSRYGRPLDQARIRQPSASERLTLEDDAFRFLSMRYDRVQKIPIKENHRAVTPGKMLLRVQGSRPGTFAVREVDIKIPGSINEGRPYSDGTNPYPCDPARRWTERNLVGEPVATKMRDEILLAEHPVTGQTWEDIGLPALYHTSLLVGRSYLERSVFETIVYRCEGNGLRRVVESKKTEFDETWRFLWWPMAHGGMGDYQENDQLKLIMVFEATGPDASQALDKITWGTTSDSGNARCRARYGAYPVGAYGVDFVCHQNINTFALIKWNLIPVWYWESINRFGPVGRLGIADIDNPCKCPVTGNANHACIPGPDCCYTVWGTGFTCGYGLQYAWHPTKHWIDSEFKFNECPVPIAGGDEYVGTFPVAGDPTSSCASQGMKNCSNKCGRPGVPKGCVALDYVCPVDNCEPTDQGCRSGMKCCEEGYPKCRVCQEIGRICQ